MEREDAFGGGLGRPAQYILDPMGDSTLCRIPGALGGAIREDRWPCSNSGYAARDARAKRVAPARFFGRRARPRPTLPRCPTWARRGIHHPRGNGLRPGRLVARGQGRPGLSPARAWRRTNRLRSGTRKREHRHRIVFDLERESASIVTEPELALHVLEERAKG